MIVNSRAAVDGGLSWSATSIVTVAVCAVVGVPEITPVVRFSRSPSGSRPAWTDHEYGGWPSVAESWAEYAAFT